MTYHFNTKYQKIHSDCLELLNSKAIFMSGSELKEYLGYDIKRISQAVVVAQKTGVYDIINVKGKGYVSTKWLTNEKIRKLIKHQVKTLENEAIDDLRVANGFKELLV